MKLGPMFLSIKRIYGDSIIPLDGLPRTVNKTHESFEVKNYWEHNLYTDDQGRSINFIFKKMLWINPFVISFYRWVVIHVNHLLLMLLLLNRLYTNSLLLLSKIKFKIGGNNLNRPPSKCKFKWPSVPRWQSPIYNGALKGFVRSIRNKKSMF